MSYETDIPPVRGKETRDTRRQVGVGDMIAYITKAFGVRPCEPCERRRQWLNQRLRFPWRY